MRKSLLILFVLAPSVFADSPWKDLSGAYHIDSAPIMEPKEPLKENTHLYLAIQGEPAKEMYNTIQAEPKFSKCGTDHFYKTSGNISCQYYKSVEEYSCDFSINIKEGTVEPARWC